MVVIALICCIKSYYGLKKDMESTNLGFRLTETNGRDSGKISAFKNNNFAEIWLISGKKRTPIEEHKYILKDNKRVIEVLLEINNIISFKKE